MRDLTRDEIEEYLGCARSDTGAGDFHQDQGRLIGEVVLESGMFETVGQKIRIAQAAGLSNRDLWLSIWVSAFQMGHECESRLITLALKGKKPAQQNERRNQ
jgi:hypothetical protein